MNIILASSNIYNKILSFMATFQEIKNIAKESAQESLTQEIKVPQLELEEAKYILALVARSDFKGQDVQIVYNIALKLQETIKTLNQ
jgi:hypothetical protein